GVINLIYNYNPKCIIIGDEMSAIGKPVLDALRRQIKGMKISRLAGQVNIELAKLGDSAYIGAAVVATHYVFENINERVI
ncbi:MAG: ROK family protein, partial [Synergistaceae bacterium]|nr:ROK family protein [Synergistaceae bacterium]